MACASASDTGASRIATSPSASTSRPPSPTTTSGAEHRLAARADEHFNARRAPCAGRARRRCRHAAEPRGRRRHLGERLPPPTRHRAGRVARRRRRSCGQVRRLDLERHRMRRPAPRSTRPPRRPIRGQAIGRRRNAQRREVGARPGLRQPPAGAGHADGLTLAAAAPPTSSVRVQKLGVLDRRAERARRPPRRGKTRNAQPRQRSDDAPDWRAYTSSTRPRRAPVDRLLQLRERLEEPLLAHQRARPPPPRRRPTTAPAGPARARTHRPGPPAR